MSGAETLKETCPDRQKTNSGQPSTLARAKHLSRDGAGAEMSREERHKQVTKLHNWSPCHLPKPRSKSKAMSHINKCFQKLGLLSLLLTNSC